VTPGCAAWAGLFDVPNEGLLQGSDARAVLRFDLRSLDVAHAGGQVRVVSDGLDAAQVARGTVEAREHAGADRCEGGPRQTVPLAEILDHLLDGAARECRNAALALVQEQAVADGGWRQWSQLFVPREDLLDQCRRLEAIGAAERAPLHAAGPGLEPNQCLSIVEQRQGLQAVAAKLGDWIRVAGRVDHDGEVVRQQRLTARVQTRLDLPHTTELVQGHVDRVLPGPSEFQRSGNDAAASPIDVFEQPAKGSWLAGVGNALHRGGLTAGAYASDVRFAGPQERSQVARRHLAA
jgi:hypothetical protein